MVVREEKREAEVKLRRVATLLPLQIGQHQETQKITQTDVEDQGSRAGEVELGASIAESAP